MQESTSLKKREEKSLRLAIVKPEIYSGDIYSINGLYYVLHVSRDQKWHLVNLIDGYARTDPKGSAKEAIKGASYVGRHLRISVVEAMD